MWQAAKRGLCCYVRSWPKDNIEVQARSKLQKSCQISLTFPAEDARPRFVQAPVHINLYSHLRSRIVQTATAVAEIEHWQVQSQRD